MIYRSCYTKTKPQHAAPLIVSDIKNMLAPLPNRYTRGEFPCQSLQLLTQCLMITDGFGAIMVTSR